MKKRGLLKILYIALLAAGMVLLGVCTLYGEGIYAWGKPSVETERVWSSVADASVSFPLAAVRSDGAGDYVYVLRAESGYSRTIYTVARVDVKGAADIWDAERYRVSGGGVRAGDRVVVSETRPLVDGCRVVVG
jgi:hypothetical protein